jgi:hypothetical protein
MIICSQCRNPNPDTSETCGFCGASLMPKNPPPDVAEPIPSDGMSPETATPLSTATPAPEITSTADVSDSLDVSLTANPCLLMNRILEFIPHEYTQLGFFVGGLFLILLAKVVPQIAGVVVYLLVLIMFFLGSGDSSNFNTSDPASSYWMGAILMLIALGWLLIDWLTFNQNQD